MLATFDPPETEQWLAEVEAEFSDQLVRLQGRPNIAVVCGGTETQQQPCLLGLGRDAQRMAVLDEVLPRVAARLLPHVPHVASSPSSPPGHFPISIERGVSHYFGVGAYLQPIEDARNARVSFASECLAFAIPPEPETLRRRFGGVPDLSDPEWRAGTMRDRRVDWDFMDVTAHYVHDLYGVRQADVGVEEWIQLCRDAVTETMMRSLAAWRSSDTPTGGAIILAHRDLRPGPGWGLLDSDGCPKAPLRALAKVLAPMAILPVSRGLEGLALDIQNDTIHAASGSLAIDTYTITSAPTMSARCDVTIPAHGGLLSHAEHALGGFRDLTGSWRLGTTRLDHLTATFQSPENPSADCSLFYAPYPRSRPTSFHSTTSVQSATASRAPC